MKKVHEPYAKFKGFIREKGITYTDIAKTLEISETSVCQKVNGKSDFYLCQIEKLKSEYGMTTDIFLI